MAGGEWTGESAHPVALTGADLPDEVDLAVAAALCVPAERGRSGYAVPDERSDTFPLPEGDAVVVTDLRAARAAHRVHGPPTATPPARPRSCGSAGRPRRP